MPSVSAEMASTGTPSIAARAVLVTVHGTFARGAPWAEPGSILARSVIQWFAKRGRTATVIPFQWSGRNSIAARRAAGTTLSECLSRIREENPQSALYVIAHSHGGSVFAYAIKRQPDLINKVDGFVALATPWVGLEPCSYAAALRDMLVTLTLYTVFVLSLLAVPSIVTWTRSFPRAAGEKLVAEHSLSSPLSKEGIATVPQPQPSLTPALKSTPGIPAIASSANDMWWIGPLIEGIVNYLFSLIAAVGLGLVLSPLRRFVSRRLKDSNPRFQSTLGSIVQESDTLGSQLPRSVFLKPIGDEAALALTWTCAMAALMQGISRLLFLSLQWMRDRWTRIPRALGIIGGLLLTAAWSLGTVALVINAFIEDEGTHALSTTLHQAFDVKNVWDVLFAVGVIWALIAWTTTLLILFAISHLLVVAMLAALGAGALSLKTALYVKISVEAIPIGSHRLVLVDVSPAPVVSADRVLPGSLSHSAMYNSPGAIRAVLESLSTFETGGGSQRC